MQNHVKLKKNAGKIPQKKKKRKLLKFFIFIIILFSIIFICLLSSPLIAVKISPFIFKTFFSRIFSYDKVSYDFLKAKLELKNINLSKDNGEYLFKIKRIYIDFNVLKTIKLKPSISKIIIENPKTYLIKSSNRNFNIPHYLEFNNKKTNPSGKKNTDLSLLLNMPVSIEHFELKNGELDLYENNKFRSIVKELQILIPGIDMKNKKQVEPVISGKFNNKSFYIKGESVFNDDSITNTFNIKLKNFNLQEISPYIPDIQKIKIISGYISGNINLNFIINKNNSPLFLLNGSISTYDLLLKDTWTDSTFLKNTSAFINIKQFDIFNNFLDIDIIKLTSGKLFLAYSTEDKEKSIFFIKPQKKSNFKIRINNFVTENYLIAFKNYPADSNYIFNNSNINISNFTNFSNDFSDYKLKINTTGLKSLSCTGKFNLKEKHIEFNDLNIQDFYSNSFKIFPESFNIFKNFHLKNFNGSVIINKNDFIIKGKGELKNIIFSFKDFTTDFMIDELVFDIERLNPLKTTALIRSIKCSNFNIPLNKNSSLGFKDISFSLPDNNAGYQINYVNKTKEFIIETNIYLQDISGDYFSNHEYFNFKLDNLVLIPDSQIKMHFNKPFKLTASGMVNLNNIRFNIQGKPVLKAKKINAVIDQFELYPLYLNCSKVFVQKPYSEISFNENKQFLLFSVFHIKKSENKKNDTAKVNIDKIIIENGMLGFTDYFINDLFHIEINDINGEMNNFPSTVYTSGNMLFEGLINDRNKVKLESKIGASSGMNGFLETKDLYLKQFLPYSKKFIGHTILTGTMDIKIDFLINKDLLDILLKLDLKKIRLLSVNQNVKNKNLSKIIPAIEDKNGVINLEIPIKGKMSDPKIDFRKIFFKKFLDSISNAGKNIIPETENFIEDENYNIIYFKPGKSELLFNENEVISDDMLQKFNTNNSYFMIEGYVDRNNDQDYLKKQFLDDQVMFYYDGNTYPDQKEELDILKKIYNSSYTEELPANITNTELKKLLTDKIKIDDTKYYALSYSRMNAVKEMLVNKYDVGSDRIFISEKNIFKNDYIQGINNSIAVLKSGRLRQ